MNVDRPEGFFLTLELERTETEAKVVVAAEIAKSNNNAEGVFQEMA